MVAKALETTSMKGHQNLQPIFRGWVKMSRPSDKPGTESTTYSPIPLPLFVCMHTVCGNAGQDTLICSLDGA